MLYVSCFHGCPISYGNTQSKFYHSVDTSKTKSVFDFLLNPKKPKKNRERFLYRLRKQSVRLPHTEDNKGITLCQIKKNYTNGCAVEAETIHLFKSAHFVMHKMVHIYLFDIVCVKWIENRPNKTYSFKYYSNMRLWGFSTCCAWTKSSVSKSISTLFLSRCCLRDPRTTMGSAAEHFNM